jgi:hypothetical protein
MRGWPQSKRPCGLKTIASSRPTTATTRHSAASITRASTCRSSPSAPAQPPARSAQGRPSPTSPRRSRSSSACRADRKGRLGPHECLFASAPRAPVIEGVEDFSEIVTPKLGFSAIGAFSTALILSRDAKRRESKDDPVGAETRPLERPSRLLLRKSASGRGGAWELSEIFQCAPRIADNHPP